MYFINHVSSFSWWHSKRFYKLSDILQIFQIVQLKQINFIYSIIVFNCSLLLRRNSLAGAWILKKEEFIWHTQSPSVMFNQNLNHILISRVGTST